MEEEKWNNQFLVDLMKKGAEQKYFKLYLIYIHL